MSWRSSHAVRAAVGVGLTILFLLFVYRLSGLIAAVALPGALRERRR